MDAPPLVQARLVVFSLAELTFPIGPNFLSYPRFFNPHPNHPPTKHTNHPLSAAIAIANFQATQSQFRALQTQSIQNV